MFSKMKVTKNIIKIMRQKKNDSVINDNDGNNSARGKYNKH